MAETQDQSFEWNEVADLFGIEEENPDLVEAERDRILERINSLTDRYGREYIIKKITLQTTH
ncbi:hypothetical protein LF599_03140 [Pseudodesulfovibrio thermohalotolerans]|jgi:hypothetical protein|uniref:hypothetical protein n=1 Tax=Pseudodesulfovibrio thermohalotolerans TaxID=2880651 RepID=UPI0024415EC0|nr:hypothetical protein [Pseudodesulfovibrio thermohalotolerans]WFS63173.1 hypothetical protein LF599_03140 [Pseudodesulfovibrio thermohalotolerans]